MLELLQEVQKPVLFVSHSRDEVYRLCDTVSCINQGRMEVIEPVKEFFRNPKTKTAALLSGCKNICAVEAMESHKDGNWLWAAEWGVALRVSKEALQAQTIGIRAHYFTGEKPVEGNYSEFPVGEYRMSLFEKTIPVSGCNGKQRKPTGILRMECPRCCM